MATFRVRCEATVYYEIEVEAPTKEAAMNNAESLDDATIFAHDAAITEAVGRGQYSVDSTRAVFPKRK